MGFSSKNLDFEVIDSDKYISTKIKSFKREIRSNFHGNKYSSEKNSLIQSTILIVSVYRNNKSYNPQTLLEERKFNVKNKKIKRYTAKDLFDSDFCSSSDNETFELVYMTFLL